MKEKKSGQEAEKLKLHPRNKHQGRYNLEALIADFPSLKKHVRPNPYGQESIDFFDPQAVKTLNQALLKHHYQVDHWDIPKGFLCPPIPGRVDYLHYVADLLTEGRSGEIPKGRTVKILDIGTGANCIYPLLGVKEYGWQFKATEVDWTSLKSAQKIVDDNGLEKSIEVVKQEKAQQYFQGVLSSATKVAASVCNPPFHSSAEEASKGSRRKIKNLKGKKDEEPVLNFSGKNGELWCKGGERRFIQDMIFESRRFSKSCLWFTCLVSKQSNLKSIYSILKKVEPIESRTIEMGQGNKKSRMVAWTFITKEDRDNWFK